jgi:hypothetical protein
VLTSTVCKVTNAPVAPTFKPIDGVSTEISLDLGKDETRAITFEVEPYTSTLYSEEVIFEWQA